MKKTKFLKEQLDSSQTRPRHKTLINETERRLILKNKSSKEELKKNISKTKTLTEFNKEDKKSGILKKKVSNEITSTKSAKFMKNIQSKNKTLDMANSSSQKKTKSKTILKKFKTESHSKIRKGIKGSLSHQNFEKFKSKQSKNYNLTINTKKSNLENNRSDSTNNLLSGADSFVKNLLSKYIDGTDNIINEDLEQFNLDDEEIKNISFFGEKDDNNNNININHINNNDNEDKSKTTREEESLKKSFLNQEELGKEKEKKEEINNDANNIRFNTSNNVNSSKAKKKVKINIKENNISNDNQIKKNIYNTLLNSPNRMSEGRLTMRAHNRHSNLYKKNYIRDPPLERKSLSKINRKEKDNEKINDSKESSLKRKILYSNKIINNLNKTKKQNDYDQKKRETIPISASNLDLDIIFENYKKANKDVVTHHYLENTVSAKNKMVQKKNINSLEHTRTTFSSFSKTYTVGEFSKDVSIFRNTIFRINQTPKIKKDFIDKDRYSFNGLNNDITRNFIRKHSHHINRELSAENNLPGMSIMFNSKIFNGKLDNYLITKELGKGSYAVVKLAVHKVTKIKYAIKIYSRQTLTDRQKRNTVKNEINILKQIDNENIMKLYDVIDTPSNLYLVLEYINGVNLIQIIKNEKPHFIKEERAKLLFSKVVKGISYCHKKNIFHRDIKLENVLVLKDDTVKIIDFGFAVKCNRETLQKLFCGTPNYMAPEIVKKEKYMACYSDIWSLGVLFYAMLFGIFPFKGKDEDELFEKICEGNIFFPEYNPISEKTKQLFAKIFVYTPNKRISLDDIIKMLNE